MAKIKRVRTIKNGGGKDVERIHVEFSDGSSNYIDRKDGRLYTKMSQDDVAAVKAVSRKVSDDGTVSYVEYGYDQERARQAEMHARVARGEAEYTYDDEGMISGIRTVRISNDFFKMTEEDLGNHGL
jgi:hypothetical protein